jgi:hypothetical protein
MIQEQRQRESDRGREETSKMRGDYAGYNTGTVLSKLANRNKVFTFLTVECIGE